MTEADIEVSQPQAKEHLEPRDRRSKEVLGLESPEGVWPC